MSDGALLSFYLSPVSWYLGLLVSTIYTRTSQDALPEASLMSSVDALSPITVKAQIEPLETNQERATIPRTIHDCPNIIHKVMHDV
jgi:hypothetical protein